MSNPPHPVLRQWLAGIAAAFAELEIYLLALLFAALLALGLWQILSRNLGLGAAPDIEVLIRILVLWVALLGALVAARRRRHIVIDLAAHYLPAAARRFTAALADLTAALASGALAWAAFAMVRLEIGFAPGADLGPLPRYVVQLPIVIAFALMALQYLLHAAASLAGHREGTA